MDARSPSTGGCERRRAPRHHYRRGLVVAHLKQPGSAQAAPYLVPTRNLSKTGVAFLHGGFVHVDTECIIHLITRDGAWQSIPGRTVRCRFVESNIHEVAVHFDEPIELSRFCRLEREFKALIAGGSDRAQAVREQAEAIGCEVVGAATCEEMKQALAREPFDAIFVSNVIDKAEGVECCLRTAKEAEFKGLVIAIAQRDDAVQRERCLLAGCDLLLPDPPTQDGIFCILTLSDALATVGAEGKRLTEKGFAFLEQVPTALRRIESAMLNGERERLAVELSHLQSEAFEVGFADVGEVAAEIVGATRKGILDSELYDKLDVLVESCLSARLVHKRALVRRADSRKDAARADSTYQTTNERTHQPQAR